MYKSIAALALLGAVSAQTTAVELFLVGFDQQALVGSVITSDSTATTYSIACSDPSSSDCGVPPSFTFTQGPSTIHFKYQILDDGDGDGDDESIELGCVITGSESGVCSATASGSISGSAIASVETASFSNGSDLGGQPVTITAGLAAVATTAASTTMTTSTSSSESSSTGSASGQSTATSTGASQTAATTSSSSSSSTAGVPKITGNAQWVVGGAAAVLALAAL